MDVYLPDMKYADSGLSTRYSGAKDYFDIAKAAVEEMYRQVENPEFFDSGEAEKLGIEAGIMKKGVIVRHLMLPGQIEDSKKVVRYIYETYGDAVYISLMNQYTPLDTVKEFPELNRKVTEKEYAELVDFAVNLGVVNGFVQDKDTAEESFIPDFDCEGV